MAERFKNVSMDAAAQYNVLSQIANGLDDVVYVNEELADGALAVVAEVAMQRSTIIMQHLESLHANECKEDGCIKANGCDEFIRLRGFSIAMVHQSLGFDCGEWEKCGKQSMEGDDYVDASGIRVNRPDQR